MSVHLKMPVSWIRHGSRNFKAHGGFQGKHRIRTKVSESNMGMHAKKRIGIGLEIGNHT